MVTFKNGTTYALLNLHGGSIIYQGAKRKTLDFRIPVDSATLDELNALAKDRDATSEITVTTSESTSIKSGYTVPIDVGQLFNEDGTSELYIKLAQKSDVEVEIEQLKKTVAALAN